MRKRKNWTFFLVVSALMSACSGDQQNKVEAGEFTVYFPNAKDVEYAEKIAVFWKDHRLMTGKEQDAKLESDGTTYRLSIIANDTSEVKSIPVEHQQLLLQLEDSIHSSIFKGKQFELVISDARFSPILTID